jgi:hypothetical protein
VPAIEVKQQAPCLKRVDSNSADLLEQFETISAKTKELREEIYRLLVEEFGGFWTGNPKLAGNPARFLQRVV